jgi:hypothetical protein
MKESYAGLAITETEWEISLDCARPALGKLGVGERETNDSSSTKLISCSAKTSESAA